MWWDLTVNRVQYAWELMREHLGLKDDPDFVVHCCRHTFASRLIQSGEVDPVTPAEMGGWKTLSMVKRYAHLDPKAKTKAIRVLNRA